MNPLLPLNELKLIPLKEHHSWGDKDNFFEVQRNWYNKKWRAVPTQFLNSIVYSNLGHSNLGKASQMTYIADREVECGKLFDTRQQAVNNFKTFIIKYIPFETYQFMDWKLTRKNEHHYSLFHQDKMIIEKFIAGKTGKWSSRLLEHYFKTINKKWITEPYRKVYSTKQGALEAYYTFVEQHLPSLILDALEMENAEEYWENEIWWSCLILPQYSLNDLSQL